MSLTLTWHEGNIDWLMRHLTDLFLLGRDNDDSFPKVATEVDTGHWQAVKDVPNTKTIEIQNVHLCFENLSSTVSGLQDDFKPNLPWAEDHFAERVSGEPLNPGNEYKAWPWYKPDWEAQRPRCCSVPDLHPSGENQQCLNCGQTVIPSQTEFSHTYMERLWPRRAGLPQPRNTLEQIQQYRNNEGIRYRYGDLNDVVELLSREPHTRQAVVPLWFPEDTGAHHGERVPCTLGYHFMLRDQHLHIFYPIRSCDFVRYFRDDAYMAARLGLWIIDRCSRTVPGYREGTPAESLWDYVTLGELNMFIPSLHIFEGDVPMLKRKGMPIMKGWENGD